jgi:hypothetical protein
MRDLVSFLKQFGFLDSSGNPSSMYMEFKNSNDPVYFVSVCAKKHYADVLPFVTTTARADLVGLFSSKFPDLAQPALFATVSTFLAIDAYAPFIATPTKPKDITLNKDVAHISKQPLNININLPETENEKVYEVIFRHLKEILSS